MVRIGGNARLKLAVPISGRGSNLQSLIDHFGPRAQEGPIEIALVVSNRPEALGLARAARAGVAHLALDHREFADRESFDAALDKAIRDSGADFVALAGFMRVLGEDIIAKWRDRLVNIHPSLLPAFQGLDTHARAIAAGVRFHGCTVHFVRHEVDNGPILAQAALAVLPGEDPASLASRVLAAEHRLYPLALRLIAEGKVRIENEIVRIEDTAFADGIWFNPLGS